MNPKPLPVFFIPLPVIRKSVENCAAPVTIKFVAKRGRSSPCPGGMFEKAGGLKKNLDMG